MATAAAGGIVSGLGSLAGGMFGANASANAAQTNAGAQQVMTREQLAEMARQFNITNPQSMAQFNAQMGQGAEQFGAGLKSAEGQFNAGQENQMNQFNASQGNQTNQFNASQGNQMGLSNAQNAGNMSQFNASQGNQMNLANAQNQGQTSQFNASQALQKELSGAGLTSQEQMFNAGLGGSDIEKKAYQEAMKNISGMGSNAEKSFLSGMGSASPELQQLQKDIGNKASKSMQDVAGQTAANLQAQGVRGGQAATLQNRAVGEVGLQAQRDINQISAQDAQARQQLIGQYQAGKAGLANQFGTSETTAKMTDATGNKAYSDFAAKNALSPNLTDAEKAAYENAKTNSGTYKDAETQSADNNSATLSGAVDSKYNQSSGQVDASKLSPIASPTDTNIKSITDALTAGQTITPNQIGDLTKELQKGGVTLPDNPTLKVENGVLTYVDPTTGKKKQITNAHRGL